MRIIRLDRLHQKGRFLTLVTISIFAFLLISPNYGFPRPGRVLAASGTSGPSVPWVTEPLQDVFIQVQYRLLGIVSGQYAEPTFTDLSTMKEVFSLVDSGISKNDTGAILSASSIASQMQYRLLPINDSVSGHRFYVLVEDSSANRGWGTYFFAAEQNPGSSPRVILEAPHPVTDFNSQNIAYEIFLGAYPRVSAFFVSGVERTYGPNGQTDMAHRTLSIFETANEAFARLGSVVIQIHSFSADRHPGYPLVVMSTGDGGTNGALQSISNSLSSSGISVGVFDGFNFESLAGTDNAQGRYVKAVGGGFVHMEISTAVVYNSTLIAALQSSVSQSINGGFSFSSYRIDPIIPAISLSVVAGLLINRLRFASRPRSKSSAVFKVMGTLEVDESTRKRRATRLTRAKAGILHQQRPGIRVPWQA